jgi:hypothetical protein
MKKAGLSSILIAVVLFAVAVIAEAQQPKKVPRIGYLSPRDTEWVQPSELEWGLPVALFTICDLIKSYYRALCEQWTAHPANRARVGGSIGACESLVRLRVAGGSLRIARYTSLTILEVFAYIGELFYNPQLEWRESHNRLAQR